MINVEVQGPDHFTYQSSCLNESILPLNPSPSGSLVICFNSSARCIGEYADLLASPQGALPALEGGAAACPAREAMPHEEV